MRSSNKTMKKNIHNPDYFVYSRGSIAVYIALMMTLVISSSAVILGGILSQQLQASKNFVASERAFYAANSGTEEALYLLVQQNRQGGSGPIEVDSGQVTYEDADASYEVSARLVVSDDLTRTLPCITSTGQFRQEERRLTLAPGGDCGL